MKVILKPVSHPEIGQISIEDTLFPIGRREEPFSSQHSEAMTKLSRRHARVFQEGGKVYITDMGSLNGTQVNDQPVQNDATLLQAGDEINLGGELSFRVEIEAQDDETSILDPTSLSTPVLLMLLPVDTNSDLEVIVVSQFPFLITRTDSVFGRYKDKYPDDVRQISRRHAVINLKGENVYVEDLDSVNGTFVSGEKLDEHAKLLADGDAIAFGGDRFSYTVRLERADQEEEVTGTVLAATDATRAVVDDSRTTFVNSATSFLDIFCAEDNEPDPEPADAGAGRQSPASAAAESGKQAGRVHRTRALAGEFRDALDSGTTVDRRKIWAGFGLVALGLIAAVAFYLLDIDRREIKELLDAGAFGDSAAVANRYLKVHPDDDEVNAWALQALLKATVPEWVESIEQGRFDAADAHLVAAAGKSQFMQHGQEMIDTLAWVARVEAHMADRGKANAPIIIFRHEAEIKTLVEEWNADPTRYQQYLSQIATYVPLFEPLHTRVLSDLRMLRNDESLYGKAISELKSAINLSLQNMDYEEIYSSINNFANKYPRVSGLKALREDAEQYETLARYMEQQDLVQVTRLRREYEFQTPSFNEQVNGWLDRSLPPADIVAQYEEAAEAWRLGDEEQAIGMLEPLTGEPWGDVAARQIERYKRVNADYEALQTTRQSSNYRERLISFRASLNPSLDEYFLHAIEEDFALFKQLSLVQLEESLLDVRRQWEAYRNAGGIPGVVRVEERVSKRFEEQAGRLSIAYEAISEDTLIYDLIQVTPPVDWQALREDIENEAKRQRRWLQDLDLVLEPALLKAKLDLLPRIKETSP